MTKQQAISKMILDRVTEIAARDGVSITDSAAVREAFNEILGEGRYEALVSDLYHSLRGE